MKKQHQSMASAMFMATAFVAGALADDGARVSKNLAPSPGTAPDVPFGYIAEAEHAFVHTLPFYVDTQRADGTVEGVEYINVDDVPVEERFLARPIVGVYIYGPSEGVDGIGFVGHGKRDAYAAVSLDDGETYKVTNLSESAVETSSDVIRSDIPLFADTEYAYPGDVVNIFHATMGNQVLVAWPSRFCEQGQPNYSLDTEEPTEAQAARRAAIAEYLGIDLSVASPDDLYLIDMYGVGGQQGQVDYAEDKWEQNWVAGVVPFTCLWTARGELVKGDDPRTESAVEASYMRWFKAERLTSGRRDVNRIETKCVAGAGCAITWQEDPEGLRPGQGEGPGEGWSGAIANSQTDIWYTYIDARNFNVVQDPADESGATAMAFQDYVATATDPAVTQKPKPFVPFAMPMRMTDNAKCNVQNPQPYCYGSALANAGVPAPAFPDGNATTPMEYGLKDMCADTVDIPTGPQQTLSSVCVTEDGLTLVGNTAATRPRLGLFGYDTDRDGVVDGAFVVVQTEEDKGLGKFGFTEEGTACDPDASESCIAFDEGKNLWYHSFSMSLTDSFALNPQDGLLANLTFHGDMLNQPEVDWQTGEFFPVRNTVDMWDFGAYNYDIFNTEIARRGSLLAQGIAKAEASSSGLIAMPSWKQGSMNQGGPADVMVRRIRYAGNGGGGGETCPIQVDSSRPIITASFKSAGNRLVIAVSQADGDVLTPVLLRNAVTQSPIADKTPLIDAPDGTLTRNIRVDEVPCAVQVADDDGSLQWGPYAMVEDAPASCVGPVPEVCTNPPPYNEGLGWDGLGNPYAFRNMVCENWAYADGSNPYYPGGVCLDSAINLSATIPDTCTDSDTGEAIACPTVDLAQGTTFGIGDTEPVLQGVVQGEGNTMKVLTWHQCPADFTSVGDTDGLETVTCVNDDRIDDSTLADQSWYNPLDVAKGHRGFIDGDFVMLLYAWSPNWRLNAKGNDRYELYIRRSFDGGQRWTNLPAEFLASDGLTYAGAGNVTCETYRTAETGSDKVEPRACNAYAAGAAEQARNVTQHKSMKFTTLDPRYAPTAPDVPMELPDALSALGFYGAADYVASSDDGTTEDIRDPSRYFVVFETGDNTTTAAGEPEPLDLYYSRGVMFGDHYQVWAEENDLTLCYPTVPYDAIEPDDERVDSGFCNEFDQVEQGRPGLEASEASLAANPGGEFVYAAWAEHQFPDETGGGTLTEEESNPRLRRIWFIDSYISTENAWTLPGTNSGN